MVAESGNPDVLRKPTELVAVLSATNLEMLPRPRLVGVRMIEMEPHHHAPPAISVHHLAYCGRVIRLAKVQTDVVSPDSNRNIVLTCCDSVLWSVNPASDIDRQRMPQVLRGGRWNESERVARRNLKPPLRFRSPPRLRSTRPSQVRRPHRPDCPRGPASARCRRRNPRASSATASTGATQ